MDQLVFDKRIPPDHYLRRVKRLIDFASFRELVKDCYSPTMGRGAADPVRLSTLEFWQFHSTLSDREVIAEAQVNGAFRLFLDLSLDRRLPVASLLSPFRTRLGVARHQALFDHVVGQARAHGLVRPRLRLQDATHVSAHIAVPHALGPLESEPEPVRARFEAALALTHQVLADRDAPERGDQVRRAVDAEARRGTHGASFDGDLWDILVDADSELGTALEVLPGNGDEARDAPAVLGAEVQAQGETAHAVSIDGMGWNGEVWRALSAPQGLAMQVYVPPSPQVNDEGRFGPEALRLDDGGQVLRCPAGERPSRTERNTNHTGWKFICARGLCAACPLQADCVPRLPKATGRSGINND